MLNVPYSPYNALMAKGETHNLAMGYILWIFGFMGAHRFYYGRPVSGTIWFLTLGLLGIGWVVDLFLMPSLDRAADLRYEAGPVDYNLAWILLTFFGVFGVHRILMGKYLTGLLYFLTLGLLGIGILYDYWTLNEQLDAVNAERR